LEAVQRVYFCFLPTFINNHFFSSLQRLFPAIATCVRNISSDSTDLKGIMADKIPKEQERVKNFRKSHGATKVGEVTVEMVSSYQHVQSIVRSLRFELIKYISCVVLFSNSNSH
jgi:hypothetical protein